MTFDRLKNGILIEIMQNRIKAITVENGKILPASDAQQRLWFINELLPDSPVYNIYRAIKINGDFQPEALQKTLNEMVRRHEALRTTFILQSNVVMQYVHEQMDIELVQFDVQDDQEQIQTILDRNVQQPFDLINGPLVRAALLKLAPDCHIFQFMVHHNVFDRRSLGILNRELTENYRYYSEGISPDLPDLDVQYADYSNWRNEKLNAEDLTRPWAYWQKQLADLVPLTLPYDHHRSTEPNTRGDRVYLDLPDNLIRNFEPVVAKHGATLFMGVLAVFYILMHRWSGETDIMVGSPYSDRRLKGSEHLFGFFVSSLIFRTDLSGDPSFGELLTRVKKTCFNSYRYNVMPLDKIVERLNPERHVNRTPLFDIDFQIQKLQPEALEFGDAEITDVRASRYSAAHDLGFAIREKIDGYDIRFEFRTDLFERKTMERMLKRFRLLIENIAAEPDKCLSEYSIVLPEEKQLFEQWNDTAKDFGEIRCLQQLFEDQVVKTPDSIVLEFEGETLTYLQLNDRANRLAHYLREQGVKADSLVGVCMERSIEMVVALYAIHKAGGGYVPLDPDNPPARLSYILSDTDSPLVLTQKRFAEQLSDNRIPVICLDSEVGEFDRFSSENPVLINTPNHLAYVIYTSGSTGNPKGVMVEHYGIVSHLQWMQDQFQLDASDRILQKIAYTFDPSVPELFWAPIAGARIILARPGGHQDYPYLASLIESQQITTLAWVPSLLQDFISKTDPKTCQSLRRITCGGEAMPPELPVQLSAFCDAKLYNVYGPTETVIEVSCYQCPPDFADSNIPIGRAIANTQLHILDDKLRPVPLGTSGELYIGGHQVARGYLNQDKLTTEKFVEDPYSQVSGARLYKTGDLARYLDDGLIEYIDRSDFQVKIRGLRIELGEIEARINDYESVRQCVVVIKPDQSGDKRIVAYFESKNDVKVDIADLRRQLRQTLPSYMVPQYFVALDRLPLTANEKIDRKALPTPSTKDSSTSGKIIEASTETEKALVKIWRELIGTDQISIDASFFDLGGHSLLAMQAISEVSKSLEYDIPVALMITDTLEQIAATIDGVEAKDTRSGKSTDRAENSLPFYFGDDNVYYGHYSKPGENHQSLGAVLLCNPIFMEGINAHGAYRRLAKLLGNAGYHVLRFDYFATGNSLGDDTQGSIEQWIKDIEVAADKLRELSGFDFISLVGLRYGAVLAAHAAVKNIDNLILWEPVFSGSEYLFELDEIYQRVTQELNVIRVVPVEKDHCEIVGYDITENIRQSFNETELINGDSLSQARQLFLVTSDTALGDKVPMDRLKDKNPNFVYSFVEDSNPLIREFSNLVTYLPGKSLNEMVNLIKAGSK